MAFAATTSAPTLFSAFSFARVSATMGRWLKHMQIARMTSVLSSMSQDQLASIGITRGEIYDYAEMLIISPAKN